MKRKSKRLEEKPHRSEPCIILILRLLCLLTIIIHLTASFFPKGRIWGINQWAYFSPLVTLPVTLLALFFLLPSFARFVQNTLKAVLSPLFGWMGKKSHLWYLIFSLLFFILFWILRTRTYFLGDGYQILSNVESATLGLKFTEPLECLLHLKAFRLAKSLLNLNAETLYVMLSCFAGSIFIFLCFLFADFLGKERSQKILVFLILISMGSMQLFFGYVEHYTFLFLSLFGFLFLSLVWLEGKTKLIFPILTFILAFSFHISALYLLPAVYFLFLVSSKKGKSHREKRILLGVSAVFLLVILFWGYKKYSWSVPPLFVPLFHDRYYAPGYTLFSLPHLSDFFNQQLLVSPVGLILILAFLLCKRKKTFLLNPITQFLLIVAVSQVLFNFIIDPGLGASRDWDMFSAVGLGYTILGLYLLLKLLKDRIKFEYLAMILVVTSLYSTIPWIALNSSESKTIQRFRNLLLIDPKKSQNGHFILVQYFKTRGQEEEVRKQNEVQRELLPYVPLIAEAKEFVEKGELDSAEAKFLLVNRIAPRLAGVHDYLGITYFQKGDLDKAETEYKQAIESASFVSSPYYNLANLYVVKGDTNRAFELYKKAVFLKIPHADAYYNLGLLYFQKGNLNKAEDLYKKTLKLKSDSEDAYVGLGNVYKEKGEFEKAIKMYQAAIQLKPDLAKAHLRLGFTYLYTHSKEEAIREFERFLELEPQGKNADQVRNVLQELRQ